MSLRKRFTQANYSRLEFDAETAGKLGDFCVENRTGIAKSRARFTVEDFRFHFTVIYSYVTHPRFRNVSLEIEPLLLVPKQFQIFGFNEPRLVLEFELDEPLMDLFERYKHEFGHQPDYDPYRPHLTFEGTKGSSAKTMVGLPVPSFPIRACRVVHEVR
ncbi:hypothetical protein HFN89_00650 [Rhizobium laguerreae]|nr:hypothetical protein [Rhizobium laguerreae]